MQSWDVSLLFTCERSSSRLPSFSYPVYSPPRKVITVEGATEAEFYFLSVIGWNRATVATSGEAESAPLDVCLILDLSLSMVYDTERPGHVWWRTCNRWRDYPCISELCNDGRYCDPLDTKIKPAAKYFVDLLSSQYDRIGLVTYNRDGMQVLPLEYDFNVVKNAIDNLDAYEHGGRSTNIGDGIMYGHQSIASEGRMDSIWAMVLLTDGRANVYRDCPGCPSDCSALACGEVHEGNHGDADSEGWAINNAIDTWHEHEVVIYTIAYGDIFTQDPSYQDLMILVADITDNGTVEGSTENFWVAPDEDALIIALEDIAERVFTRLLR